MNMRFATLFATLFSLPTFLALLALPVTISAKPSRQGFSPANLQRRVPLNIPTPATPTLNTGDTFVPVKKLKQHRERRAILDVCAYIDVDTDALLGPLGLLGIPALDGLLDLKLCLCLSALPVVLEANANLKLLSGLLGKDKITAALAALINASPNSKHCSYPEHGKLQCSPQNPCDFTCDPPYVKEGDKCVCKAPYMSCNDQCGYFPHGCGSAVPYPKRFSA